MATHSSILAWRIPWTEELGRATVHGVTALDKTEHLPLSAFFRLTETILVVIAFLK